MMEVGTQPDIAGFLHARLRKPDAPTPERIQRRDTLRALVTSALAKQIHQTSGQTTEITTVGNIGIIPPPQQSEVARAQLQGKPIPPVKEAVNEIATAGDKNISPRIHVVLALSPMDLRGGKAVAKIHDLLASLSTLPPRIEAAEGEAVVASPGQLDLHFIVNNGMGRNMLQHATLHLPLSLEQGLNTIADAIVSTTTMARGAETVVEKADVFCSLQFPRIVDEIYAQTPEGEEPIIISNISQSTREGEQQGDQWVSTTIETPATDVTHPYISIVHEPTWLNPTKEGIVVKETE